MTVRAAGGHWHLDGHGHRDGYYYYGAELNCASATRQPECASSTHCASQADSEFHRGPWIIIPARPRLVTEAGPRILKFPSVGPDFLSSLFGAWMHNLNLSSESGTHRPAGPAAGGAAAAVARRRWAAPADASGPPRRLMAAHYMTWPARPQADTGVVTARPCRRTGA